MSLINADDNWLLLFVIAGTVALGVWLEHRFKWAAKISALVIILLLAIVFSNISLIPSDALVYDFVWDYFLPLSLPLLLFRTDIKKIFKESGQLTIAFIIGSVGTVIGTLVAYFIFRNSINELPGLSAMMTGTYIGGSVNFAVLGSSFDVSETTISAATIADNLNMAIYLLILSAIPVRLRGEMVKIKMEKNEKPRTLSTKDISIGIGAAIFVVAVSNELAGFFIKAVPASNNALFAIRSLVGNRYMWITTLSVIVATVFSKQLKKIAGLQEIGTFLIYCFVFVIGAPASVPEIIKNSPLMLVFALLIVMFNMLFTFGVGHLFHMDRETLIIASNANVGGPTTAASMAVAKGWSELVGPAVLIGCLGYIIGNYLGIIVGNMLL